ncbi:PEFG-CTERM sorting domain-containing protein [Nitrosopumilus ureiphilus]|uniref:PEFG-CTERM sorting domain-containing protein n=1 Tax=Nitrosopumilus ureiphilus TaxID=1470067 RepID=A0A7D5RB68_9ARCH|nr:PEFG-CTERM sorting domain-containing protein [Nitrosopumilus ureiphilus]QLH06762.1 PEFG-CTERM sorting domain-containing protein [Nitrosopumilus ureiphilus]
MNNLKIILGIAVISLLISGIPPGYSFTLGEEWASIKSLLSDAEKSSQINDALDKVNQAKSIYENNFKQAALESDPASNTLIENAFSDIISNLNSGDVSMAELNRQIVDKTIYTIAYLKIDQSIKTQNSEQLLNWYSVMEKKFKISEKESFVTNHAIEEITADADEIEEYGDVIRNELLGIFKLKIVEELEEAVGALEKEDVASAKKFTYEGLYYYRTLHPSVIEKLGEETASELLHEMEESVATTSSETSILEMKNKLVQITEGVELIVREYEGQDLSSVGLALSAIRDRLNLVDEEYADAVDGGKIINQEEYDETLVFLNKAITLFETHYDSFNEISNTDTEALKNNLNQIKSIIDSKGNPSEIGILVAKSQNNVAQLAELYGGVEEITSLEYVAKIKDLLNDVKEHYALGHNDMALQFATTAYLDNYEFIEGDLGYHDPELMEKIEHDLREELREMIRTGAPSEDVNAHVDMILEDLTIAEKIVPEFGTITLLVLLVSITTVVIFSKKLNLSIIKIP